MVLCMQGRVSDAHLRGEAACAKLQEKLDISGAALQTAASQHKELDKQKKAADRKLVCYDAAADFPFLCILEPFACTSVLSFCVVCFASNGMLFLYCFLIWLCLSHAFFGLFW